MAEKKKWTREEWDSFPLFDITEPERVDFGAMGLAIRRDVSYGYHPWQVLDIFRPADAAEPLPLVIWIHGGGWSCGNIHKAYMPERQMAELSRMGFVVATVEYRQSQHAPFPGPVADCRSAVRWLRCHAEEFGIDPAHVGVWGESAGGHLAALMGAAGHMPGWVDERICPEWDDTVQAAVPWYGPCDMLASAQRKLDAREGPYARMFGLPLAHHLDTVWEASPLRYAMQPGRPPFLVMHGDRDKCVPIEESEKLVRALRAAGNEAEFYISPNQGHGFLKEKEAYDRINAFFIRMLKK